MGANSQGVDIWITLETILPHFLKGFLSYILVRMKTCTKCLISKPLSDFYKCRREADGLQYRCKACCNASTAEHDEADPIAKIERHRDWYYRNQDRKRANYLKYRNNKPS